MRLSFSLLFLPIFSLAACSGEIGGADPDPASAAAPNSGSNSNTVVDAGKVVDDTTPDSGVIGLSDSGVDSGVVIPPDPPAEVEIDRGLGKTPTENLGTAGQSGNAVLMMGTAAKPELNAEVIDPVFGTHIRRLTNVSAAGGFGTHVYSQLQAFSADGGHVLLIEDGTYLVRKTSDLTRIQNLDTESWNAPRWHPTRPNILVHFDSNGDQVIRYQETNIDTGMTIDRFTFPEEYLRVRPNQSFDELSDDGRWLTGMAGMRDGSAQIFAVDIESGTLGAQLGIPALFAGDCAPDPQFGALEPDWIAPSPLGRYLVVQWVRDGTARCSGLETFDILTGAFTGRVTTTHAHGDLGLAPDGTSEYFMTFDFDDAGRLGVAKRDLPGLNTVSPPQRLLELDYIGGHISCRGLTGTCLVTTGGGAEDGWSPFEGELFLIAIDGGVRRLVHHRSSQCGYWVQSRGSVSANGRYVIFASDWGLPSNTSSCGASELGSGEAFVIDLLAP